MWINALNMNLLQCPICRRIGGSAQFKEMMNMDHKPFIIIVEGPQGVGKTTLTNWLRDNYKYCELMRLTGSAPISKELHEKVGLEYHIGALERCENLVAMGCFNVIMDRSYFSEAVYAVLYKGYNPFDGLMNYCQILGDIATRQDVNILIINLKGTEDFFEKSLKRNKPDYQDVKYGVETSIAQQDMYERLMRQAEIKLNFLDNIKWCTIMVGNHTNAESIQSSVKNYLDKHLEV